MICELKDFRNGLLWHVALDAVAFGFNLAFGLRRILVAIRTGVIVAGSVV